MKKVKGPREGGGGIANEDKRWGWEDKHEDKVEKGRQSGERRKIKWGWKMKWGWKIRR